MQISTYTNEFVFAVTVQDLADASIVWIATLENNFLTREVILEEKIQVFARLS